MALDVLGWSKETREDVNFVLESKLLFTPASSASSSSSSSSSDAATWRRGWVAKMSPVSALLVTLGRNSLEPPVLSVAAGDESSLPALQFSVDTRVKQAALLLIREKNNRYNLVRVISNLMPICTY